MEDLPDGTLRVHGLGNGIVIAPPYALLDCGESGSTLRFLIPVGLLIQGEASFTGRGRLMERPLKPYEDLFREKGIAWKLADNVLTVNGGRGYGTLALDPGTYRLPGNVSSQFFTGLLFVMPLLEGDSTLVSTTPLESRDYLANGEQVWMYGIAATNALSDVYAMGGEPKLCLNIMAIPESIPVL